MMTYQEHKNSRCGTVKFRTGIYYILILSLGLGLATGCNPTRRIDMLNRSSGDVEITWTLKDRDSMYLSPFFISNSDQVQFNLKPQSPMNEVRMSFGMGSWRPRNLYEITDRLKALTIKSPSGTIELNSSEDIYNFLMNRRTGWTKRKIVIELNDQPAVRNN